MKASIKFRDDDRPLLRAKVPVGVLGLPFLSGLTTGGNAKDLRFDLSTAFPSGPALAAEFNVLSSNPPTFSLLFKPRVGDFALASTVRSPVIPRRSRVRELLWNLDHRLSNRSRGGHAEGGAAVAGAGGEVGSTRRDEDSDELGSIARGKKLPRAREGAMASEAAYRIVAMEDFGMTSL